MCPQGYVHNEEEEDFVLCQRTIDDGGVDEMVRVGDIWVDRYEATVWANANCTGTQYGDTDDWASVEASFPFHGNFSDRLFACSVVGETPSAYLTWFQAQAACAASGKRLLTNAEWQAAAEGTADPGTSSGDGGTCVTRAGSVRETGGGTHCVSNWGVEDMIGNLWEMTSDWYGQGADGSVVDLPVAYNGDGMWAVDPAEVQGPFATGFPPVGQRGDCFTSGTQAGVFAFNLEWAPSGGNRGLGFRCARGF